MRYAPRRKSRTARNNFKLLHSIMNQKFRSRGVEPVGKHDMQPMQKFQVVENKVLSVSYKFGGSSEINK